MRVKSRPRSGGFLLLHRDFSAGVFNTFVENAVEKRPTDNLNGSWADASALCTGVVAGTLVVPVKKENPFHFG
jgi:hypothetical protein